MEFDSQMQRMKLLGFFTSNEESLKSKIMRLVFLTFVLFVVSLNDVLCIAYRMTEPYSVTSRLWLVFHFLGSHSPLKRLYFSVQQNKVTALFTSFNEPFRSESEEFNSLEADMRLHSKKKMNRFINICLSYQIVTLSVFFSSTVVRFVETIVASFDNHNVSSLNLLSPIYWPTETINLPTFCFLTFWQCFCVIYNTGLVFTIDAYICMLSLAVSERAAFLARTAPQALLPGPDNTITPQFRAWVMYHQHYLRIIDQINNTMGPLLLYNYSMTYCYFILFFYALLQIPDSTIKAISIFSLIGTVINLLISSLAGQKVLNQSIVLRNSVVGVAQVSAGGLGVGPARNALQVLVTRLSGGAGPEKITGLGFFTISMEFSNTVLSSAFSYLMILLSFK